MYEELFFRNLLQGYLQTKLPVVWSILIVSVYFGSFHFGYVYVGQYLVLLPVFYMPCTGLPIHR
ncbi:CPBP family intramembrane glutamic endopeptidase [Rossellomorea vietnamensis]|uniref:CPBP family intramembrane glutamic endopeptidase n=1 Tax=Rossellomorea vietnamensis TaxID=218284 RepID=UPI0033902F47